MRSRKRKGNGRIRCFLLGVLLMGIIWGFVQHHNSAIPDAISDMNRKIANCESIYFLASARED